MWRLERTSPRQLGQASPLARRLVRELEGEVLFDKASRGRYSTDASIYQVEPVGVVVPRHEEDLLTAVAIAADAKVPILCRGGGTSQCGQTVNEALVIDCSKHLDQVLTFDPDARTATVQPGLVLDHLNRQLKGSGLWFPVDISTGSRATLGGMTANNSCGSRSLRYGNTVRNVHAVDAVLADGTHGSFGPVPGDLSRLQGPLRYLELVRGVRALAEAEGEAIRRAFPDLNRRVGGYNLETIHRDGHNMAHLLVGSEGTLAAFTRIQLALQPLPAHRVLGICHFPTFHAAMASAQHLVTLGPTAVELVDRTMIELSRDMPQFAATVDAFLRGEPEALLLVEFAGDDLAVLRRHLARLHELMGDLGFGAHAVVDAVDPAFQGAVWEVRKAGLNIMMSMKSEGKPVSFIEDCAVPLEHLADYTARLTDVFHRHGTRGTWYAHASEGCLHVRPILNLKDPAHVAKMRAIAEEAFAMVREYKGSHSGEHGDGIVRSEFHEAMYGPRVVAAFKTLKGLFDPHHLFNPGRIVDPPAMDDRRLLRYKPGYRTHPPPAALDWSDWPTGLGGAVEMCNNNGACRKFHVGVMCPSYRVTKDEQHLVRGRANTLRLALSGQLGPDAFTSKALYDTMALCVSCKACRRECPTGVDMAKMKVEFLHHYHRRHGTPLKERLIAHLPRYAPLASQVPALANARDGWPGLAWASEKLLGFSAKRPLPRWRRDRFRAAEAAAEPRVGDPVGEVALWVDTFNTYFEPENPRAALRVLAAGGYRVAVPAPPKGRPLCCGGTFLAAGLVERAREEARRTAAVFQPLVQRGVRIVGREPACRLTERGENASLLPPSAATTNRD
ncbi:MAG: FAD-binding and (Fe-S)-binding domain-containing protein, partial [Candidatus Competibacterales bacterium]